MNIRKPVQEPRPGRGWVGVLVLELLALPVLGLVLVWNGIERTDTTYFINKALAEVHEKQGLYAKLKVEQERLLSPHELLKKAEEFGMKEPQPGQVRKMEIK